MIDPSDILYEDNHLIIINKKVSDITEEDVIVFSKQITKSHQNKKSGRNQRFIQ